MKKIIKILFILLLFSGCKPITYRLTKTEQEKARIGVILPTKDQKSSLPDDGNFQETSYSTGETIVESDINKETGELLPSVEMQGITVVAKSRNIPERAGKVSLDFIVSVPERLISNKWQLKLTPVLYKNDGERVEFERLLLSGVDFIKTQQAGYKKYEEFLNSIIPDSLYLQQMINQKGYHKALADLEEALYQAWKKDLSTFEKLEKKNSRYEIFNKHVAKNQTKLKGENILSVLPEYWLFRELDSVKIGSKYTLYKDKDNIVRRTITPKDSTQLLEQFFRKKKIEENERKKNMIEDKYEEFVRFPFEKARLDTVIRKGDSFEYYYTQEVMVDENSTKMDLTIEGMVLAKDESKYDVPESDTITYYVSSMVQFLDYTPRYVFKVIERKAESSLTAYINYKSGKTNVDPQLDNNAEELEKIQQMIENLTFTGEFILDSITLVATASPEGSENLNYQLSKQRAIELKTFLVKELEDLEGIDTLIRARWIGEDWNKLTRLVESSSLPNREGILAIIGDDIGADQKETIIRNRFPVDYNTLRNEFYPQLRAVDFTFNLHRRGMIQDTIHTKVIDTEYEGAISMLEKRKYKEALVILSEYNDYNTGVCLMSLGYDERALEILLKQPDTANRNYLIAILYSRLKNNEKAVQYYLRSCEQDDSKEFRGALDPEINKLIQMYKLNF